MKLSTSKYQANSVVKALKKWSAMVLVWVLNFGRKDTPVLMANTYQNTNQNRFKISNAKSLAVAAAMPIVAVPIQDVQLLDYAVAHETVNEQNNLIASTDEDLYMGLLDGDPYTSPQQKQRDKYELNDDDWYSVSFEQVDGTSKCHFALHDDLIKKQGYESEKVVNLNLPEQGINGPFRVTAIKHIIPQKKPTEDAGDGYDWKPVTGLFEHQSNQVYEISFDNGEKLGVTYQHPIYSVSEGDWRLAGELEVEEEVLTNSGNAKVVSSTKKEGSETVYNLEIKELHNFLVGNQGAVVHNACVSGGPCDFLWQITHKYGSPNKPGNASGWESPLEHIQFGHTKAQVGPGGANSSIPAGTKSYFNDLFDNPDDLQSLVTEMVQDFASDASTLVEKDLFGQSIRFVVDFASKPQYLKNGAIGFAKDGTPLTKVRVTLNADLKVYNAFPSNTLQ